MTRSEVGVRDLSCFGIYSNHVRSEKGLVDGSLVLETYRGRRGRDPWGGESFSVVVINREFLFTTGRRGKTLRPSRSPLSYYKRSFRSVLNQPVIVIGPRLTLFIYGIGGLLVRNIYSIYTCPH